MRSSLRTLWLSAPALALAIALPGATRALAEPLHPDAPVQRFVIPPRAASSAVRIDLANRDRTLASWTAHAIAVLEAPNRAKTWPFGRSGRALLISTTDDCNQHGARVLAIEDGCEWHEPRPTIDEVRPGPATFTFTSAIPSEQRTVPVRWEASASGVRVQRALASDWYRTRSLAARQELSEILGGPSDCALGPRKDGPHAIELATDIYVWAVAARADETQARVRLAADLAATPECALAFVSSPGWRAKVESGAIAFAERLADGRFDTGVDSQDAACDEVPVTVQIVPTSRSGSAARTASSILPEWTDLGF